MMIDLLSTKDTNFVGQIGEVVARKYLWQNGISVYVPGRIAWLSSLGERPDLLNSYTEVEKEPGKFEELNEVDQNLLLEYSVVKKFGEERIRYLKNLFQHGSTWGWDYAGYGRHNTGAYLIEVKTSRVGKKYGLKGSWSGRSRKGYSQEDLEGAKALEFKLLLVNVELLDNWQLQVSHREL